MYVFVANSSNTPFPPNNTFKKMLSNGLKPCANRVDVVTTDYSRFKNGVDGLGRKRYSRTLNLLKIPTLSAIRRRKNVLILPKTRLNVLRMELSYFDPTRDVLRRSVVGQQIVQLFSLYYDHTKPVLSMFLKMLQNGLKQCAN